MKEIHKGQIEALEFMAKQFHTYADDNEELNRRYHTKGKALEIANKRTQTWRDAAADCEHYAQQIRNEISGVTPATPC